MTAEQARYREMQGSQAKGAAIGGALVVGTVAGAELGVGTALMNAGRSGLGWLTTTGAALWNGAKELFSRGSQAAPAIQQEAQAAAQEVNIGARSLQHAFKHAADFGVSGNWNNANASAFKGAIENHLADKGTELIEGTYRGNEVLHHFNSSTGLNVITTKAGEFISGWKLSLQQTQHLLKDGKLGGG